MTDDAASIRTLYAQNVAALGAGDTNALAQLYEPDAVCFPPDSSALRGWNAIRESLERQLASCSTTASVEVDEIVTVGGWAFASGSYRTVTAARGIDQEEFEVRGNWLDVLRQQAGGSWRISRSTWTNKQ